jgi:hypothetical protein
MCKNNVLFVVFILLILPVFIQHCYTQTITISGKIIDDDTEEAVAFCSVFLNSNPPVGVTSDMDGNYTIKVDLSAAGGDSIGAVSIGYNQIMKKISKDITEQVVNFRLKSESLTTGEVVILAGENPANEIIRQIIKNKKRNEKKNFDSYEVEVYSKTELDLDNLDPKLKDGKLFKDLQFIFDNIDSVSDAKPFLPAYVAERMSDIYYVNSTKQEKEIVKAQNVSGISNSSVVDFINRMHDKYSIYDNYITMLGKEFISPFSNFALGTYEFYIIDSTFIQNEWSYKLKFKPKRVQENTYYGDFWVSMENYGVQILNMRMSPEVNINLVNRVLVYQEFIKQDSLWLPFKEKTVIDFAMDKSEKRPGIIGRKTQMYKSFVINDDNTQVSYKKVDPEDVNFKELKRDSSYWRENRHEKLSKNEEAVYKMVDSIKQVPVYKTFAEIINTLSTGFQDIGPLEIGPYWDILNVNNVEGFRLGLGLGTSSKFSKKLRLFGYTAYGFHDKKWKYKFLAEYVFSNQRRKTIGAQFRNDVVFESRSSEERSSQGIFAGFIRRGNVPPKIINVIEGKVYYRHTWKRGWSNSIALLHRELKPYGDSLTISNQGFNYGFIPDSGNPTSIDDNIKTTEIIFKTRYAYKERLFRGIFSDVSLGSIFPILELTYTAGIKGILDSKYDYHRLTLNIKHWFKVGSAGWFEYNIDAGKVFGKLPFLLLEPHPGNDAFFYNKNSFNMMNSFEFVSDTWVGLRVEQHFDGFFLNRIPLLRKLKLRELVFFRGVWGTLTKENLEANKPNLQVIDPNDPSKPQNKDGAFYGSFNKGPYMEAGFGIENIFKFIRVDALWRLSYWENRYAQKFSVRFTMSFNF